MKTVNLRVEDSQFERLQEFKRKSGLQISETVRRAIDLYLVTRGAKIEEATSVK